MFKTRIITICGLLLAYSNSCIAETTVSSIKQESVTQITKTPLKKQVIKKTKAPKITETVISDNTTIIQELETLKREVAALKRKNKTPRGAPEEIEGQQGSFKVSRAETAAEEAKEWDALGHKKYDVKRGFIRFPGTDTYLRIYGFALLVGALTRHEHVAGYTADYSLFPGAVAPSDKPGLKERKTDFNMLVNESRIGFESFSLAKIGDKLHPLKVLIECDFADGDNGSSSITKDYRVKLRHAYLTFGNFLLGKTTTLIADPDASAETINGPTGSTTSRVIQIRYVHNINPNTEVKIALERHKDTYMDKSGNIAENAYVPNLSETKKNKYHSSAACPALAMSIKKFSDEGHVGAAIAIRHISLNSNDEVSVRSSKVAVCGRISGSVNFLKEDSLFGIITYGQAPGKYLSDADETLYLDEEKNILKKLNAFGYSIGLRHFWTQKYKVRSTLAVGYIKIDNPSAIKDGNGKAMPGSPSTEYKLPPAVVRSLFSVTANVMMSLLPNLELGIEYSYGKKKLEDHRRAANQAVIFSARLDF